MQMSGMWRLFTVLAPWCGSDHLHHVGRLQIVHLDQLDSESSGACIRLPTTA
jgi:hypothetical protein